MEDWIISRIVSKWSLNKSFNYDTKGLFGPDEFRIEERTQLSSEFDLN